MKREKKKRILVSGGWGYGNLGDDAILLATIDLVRNVYPFSEIRICSYDPFYTRKLLQQYQNVEVVTSAHRILFGKNAYRFLGIYGKSIDIYLFPILVRKVFNRLRYCYEQISRIFQKSYSDKKYKYVKKVSVLFNDVDLFIMSGGGYFNSWEESAISHMCEIDTAHELGINTALIGQTIGPFSQQQSSDIYDVIRKVQYISVRDIESKRDLSNNGIKTDLAPDLALSQFKENDSKSGDIVFIPAEFPESEEDIFLKDLVSLAQSTQSKIRIVQTRLYNSDVRSSKIMFNKIRSFGVESDYTIEEDFFELENIISSSKLVISRNLHGLILGFRAGVPCICLNTDRKFLSFMEQISSFDAIIDLVKYKSGHLLELSPILDLQKNKYRDVHNAIAEQIVKGFNKGVDTCFENRGI